MPQEIRCKHFDESQPLKRTFALFESESNWLIAVSFFFEHIEEVKSKSVLQNYLFLIINTRNLQLQIFIFFPVGFKFVHRKIFNLKLLLKVSQFLCTFFHRTKDTINQLLNFFYQNGFVTFGCWSLKFSKQLESTFAAFLSSGFGPQRLNFSIVECWWRMANRLTWTGIGTTIFVPPFDAEPRLPMLCEVRPALTRFHLARLLKGLANS